jgi:hypothetical protein
VDNLHEQAHDIAPISLPLVMETYRGSGRPSSLTVALADRIGERLYNSYPSVAARACGVAARTFERWTAQGKADEEAEIDSIYAYMWRVIDQKDAEGEIALIDAAASGKMGWQGPMTVASRKHRARWEDKQSDGNRPAVIVQIGAGATDIRIGAHVVSPTLSTSASEGLQIQAGNGAGSDNQSYVNQTK